MGVKKDGTKSKSSKSKSKRKRREPGCCMGTSGDGFFDRYFRPIFSEFIGTTLFVFLVTMSLTAPTLLATAAVQGLGFALLGVTFGPVSGGHFNPSLTLTAMLAGALNVVHGIFYIIFQLAGAIAGAALTRGVLANLDYDAINGGSTVLGPQTSIVEGFVTELVLTFILVITFTVAVLDYKVPAARFAVGLTILVDVVIGLDKTGASMNPARSFGPAVIRTFDSTDHWDNHWVYWVGPNLGAITAVVLFRFVLADPEHRKVCAEERDLDTEED